MQPITPDDVVVLQLPPSARWIRLARLVATGVANSAGFSADALEDARVAIDEACGVLVERQPTSPLDLRFWAGDSVIQVHVSCRDVADREAPTGLVVDVLQAVTSTWAWLASEEAVQITFVITDEPASPS